MTGCVPAVRANCTETSGWRSTSVSFAADGLGGLVDGHAHHADAAVGRPQVHHALGLDDVEVVDRLVGNGERGADLQHVVDVDAVRRQGDHFQHFDRKHVRRLDDVGRQRDLIDFPRRLHARRHRAPARYAV